MAPITENKKRYILGVFIVIMIAQKLYTPGVKKICLPAMN